MSDKNFAVICAGSMSSSVNAARSLGTNGVGVMGVAFESGHPLLHSKYCDESHILTNPQKDYQGFLDELLRIASRENVETIVPLNPYDIYSLIDKRELLTAEISLPIVDPETYESVWDGLELLSIASELDIPVPEHGLITEKTFSDTTTVVKSRYPIIEQSNSLQYPGVRFLSRDNSITPSDFTDSMGHEPLVQEYVDNGTEFGFFALFDSGDPVVTFQHKRVRSTKYFGGASSHREAVQNPVIKKYGMNLLQELDWNGPAMVEFRRNDDTGEYVLMEINPRFWGSLALSLAAGIEFPYLYYQMAVDGEMNPTRDYDTSAKASYLRAELQHFQSLLFDDYPDFVEKPSVPGSISEITRSLPGTSFDMLSLDDPQPFFWDYIHSVQSVLRGE